MTKMQTHLGEFTYDLPGPGGGHRALPVSFTHQDQPLLDDEGVMTDYGRQMLEAAAVEVDEMRARLIGQGARNVHWSPNENSILAPEE